MRRRNTCILGSLLFVTWFTGAASAQHLEWATRAGSTTSSDIANSVAVDGSGNTYVTGSFAGTATFGPDVNGQTVGLTSTAGSDDIFVAKYNSSGALLWARRAGGNGNDQGSGIAVDGTGSSYVIGFFEVTATFASNQVLASAGSRDVFVAKYGSSGTLLWAKRAGGVSSDEGYGIAVEAGTGNIHATGIFQGTATFGPGEASQTSLTSAGGSDIFVAAYDSGGGLLWAKRAGGASNDGTTSSAPGGLGLAVDGLGSSYVTGSFSGTAQFDAATSLTSAGVEDLFLAKYDSAGTLAWVRQAGGTNSDIGQTVGVDVAGNSYVTGRFRGTSWFDAATALTATGNLDVFLAKYDSAGTLVWARKAGGTGNDFGQAVAVDAAGNSYVTGYFSGTAWFDADTALTTTGSFDVFLAKYNTDGELVGARRAGGTNIDRALSIAVDAAENAYVTGGFVATATFGLGEEHETTLTNTSFTDDVFLAKYATNTAPAISAGQIERQQGSGPGPAVTIATVSDAETGAGDLIVFAETASPGVDLHAPDGSVLPWGTSLLNTDGTITAPVSAACSATVGPNVVRLMVSDGSRTAAADLFVNVTANTAPTLGTYAGTVVGVGASVGVSPDVLPADNGAVNVMSATASAGFTGTLSVDLFTGKVSVENAGPVGTHTITVAATDNCGATKTTTFTVTVERVQTTTVLTTSSTSSRLGQVVRLVAIIPNASGGEVKFWDGDPMFAGATFLGTGAWIPAGGSQAVLLVGTLRPGMHTLFATYGGSNVSAPSTSAGVSHGVTAASGALRAWGENFFGQLGDGTTDRHYTPLQVLGLTGDVVAAAGGWGHSLALKADGTVWSWGRNDAGQLGRGYASPGPETSPAQVSGLSDIVAIAAGTLHSLALKADGTVWAWGHNGSGQLGTGSQVNEYAPKRIDLGGPVAAIATAEQSVALMSNGAVKTWGNNAFGKLGIGKDSITLPLSTRPVAIDPADLPVGEVIAIAAGANHTLASTIAGTVYAWGYNAQGQLGDGAFENRDRPVAVDPVQLHGVAAIAAGALHSLAVLRDGTVRAWGSNTYGQLGDDRPVGSATPVDTQITNVAGIAAGLSHSVAVDSDGLVWWWGFNSGRVPTPTTTAAVGIGAGHDTSFVIGPVTAAAAPTELSFGRQRIGTRSATQSVMVTNTGSVPLVLRAMLTGQPPGQFAIDEDECSVADVEPGDTCAVQISFAPTPAYGDGPRNASLSFLANVGAALPSVLLSGDGFSDDTPPVTTASVSPLPNAAGWHNAAILSSTNGVATVTLTATDEAGGSGAASITWTATGAETVQPTTVSAPVGQVGPLSTAVALFAEGTITITYFATDWAGNASAPQTFTVRIDRTPPVITLTTPPVGNPGATYALGQTVVSNYSCLDGGLSGAERCVAPVLSGNPIDTSSAGQKTFGILTTDQAGNTASLSTVYTVAKATATVTLTSARASSKSGEAVAFTVRVSRPAEFPSTVAPTGTVELFDGSVSIGKASLREAPADTVVTAVLYAVGSHGITARYLGDTNFAASESLALAHTVLEQPRRLTVTEVPTVAGRSAFAQAINRMRDVAGRYLDAAGNERAFVYRDGRVIDLSSPDERASWTHDINDAGDAVGAMWANDGSFRALVYRGGQRLDIGTLGGFNTEARAINGSGVIVGNSFTGEPKNHAFVYRDGQMIDLGTLGGGTSTARGLNDRGDIVGFASLAGDTRSNAFLYRPDQSVAMIDLGPPSGQSAAHDINNSGQVVGVSSVDATSSHAVLWTDGMLKHLGTLGGQTSSAVRINDAGQVIGQADTVGGESRPFLYQDGVMTDLNALLPADSGLRLLSALGLNEAGDIAATVVMPGGVPRAVILSFNRPPVASASATPNPAEAAGPDGAAVTLDGSASSDPDGDAVTFLWQEGEEVLATTDIAPVTLALGTHTITLTVTDAGGLSSSVSVDVVVQDTTPPHFADMRNIGVEAEGPEGAVVAFPTEAADIVDRVVPATCAPVPGTTFALGTTQVICTATDAAGNRTEGTFDVTVVDTTAPILTLLGADPLTIEGGTPFVDPGATAADTVAGDLTAAIEVSGSVDTTVVGSYVLTYSVSDPSGNTATATRTVTVVDTTPPAITVPANITGEATGAAGRVVSFAASAADVVDGAVATTCTPASGSTFAVATTTVTCAATDGSGNTGSASFTVTVADTTPPEVTVPANITADATGPAGSVVSFTASAVDVVDGAVATMCTPLAGSTFAISTTTVTCSATDGHNNTGTASFTVTVADTTAPVVTAPANMTGEATGAAGRVVSFTASASDVVDGAVVTTCTPASGSTFAIGTTTVTCSATDGHSNTGTASFTVIVADTTPPAITVPANITGEATGAAGRVVSFTASAADVVDGAVATTCTPASGSTFAIGTTAVLCSASDGHSNTGTASFTVTVADTTPPEVTVPANITADATGPAGSAVTFTTSAIDLVDGSIATTCTPASGSMFAIGTTPILCSATDGHGNAASALFTVTILSAEEITSDLISDVTALDFTQASGLLQNVVSSIDGDNLDAACGQLGAFIGLVQAQSGKKITSDEAAMLLQSVTNVKGTLGCK